MTHAPAATSFVDLNRLTRIELLILKRLAGGTAGDHRSRADGSGFDFVGLRDWQAGDRFSAIDWPQSSLTNFAPLVVREFDQPSAATVLAVADASLSTRCGVDGTPLGAVVARALATIGLSAAFFQDRFGLLTFDRGFARMAGIPARTGRGHVVHCLEAYEARRGLEAVAGTGGLGAALTGSLRAPSLVPVVSDFLFDEAPAVVRELARVNVVHDVFVVLVDSRVAFDSTAISASWITVRDIEGGAAPVISRGEYVRLATRAAEWQAEVVRQARAADLDVVVLGADDSGDIALADFVAERRLRKAAR